MRNIPFLLWVLLLVDGEETIEETEGESVTLEHGEIVGDDTMQWWFGGKMIAKFNKNNINETYPGPNNIFSGRLKLDHQTGFLTIENISPEHGGLYELKIKSTKGKTIKFHVTVSVESVSVMVGDSVTLNINDTETEKAEELVWTIEGGMKNIAKFDRKAKKPPIYDTERFRGRLKLDHQTGSLTIMNITNITDSGEYQLQIKSSSSNKTKGFKVAVQGGMKTVSVMEGEPIILYTGLIEIKGYDLILWKFEDHLIAEVNKETNQFLTHDSSAGGRFKGRLQPSEISATLTIRGSRSTDSGVYNLQMNSSSHTVQRNISVTVSGVFGDEVKTVIVMEGESVTLNSDLADIQNYRRIVWRFGSDLIAEISEGKISYKSSPDGSFRDRLQLDSETAYLTITNMRMKHSGLYKLEAVSTTSGTTHKKFSVSVDAPDLPDQKTPESGLSPGAVAGIVVTVLLVVCGAAAGGWIYYRKKNSEPKGRNDIVKEPKESNDPLTSGTVNGEGSQSV